ncbi:MAG: hypothetical protein ABIK07_20865 [Planctomycetota bacterium]|uniref:hypothetical protein n=1 Tax=uncultured Gimesia sp. TaxID=1678688 RepID=UPI00260998F5|nr:hypothetical protein [uncultured Gimesia sp.]
MSLTLPKTCYLTGIALILSFCAIASFVNSADAENPQEPGTVTVSSEAPQSDKTPKPSITTNKENKASTGISAEREKLAIEFAKLHHPELAELIQKLKQHKPREYKRAIRDLDTTLTKLDRFKSRESERYRLTLERWEVDSRIRLLAARVSVMGTSDDKSELKSLLTKRVDLQLELLRYDQKMAEKRIEKIQNSIKEIEKNRETLVDTELTKIKRSIKKTGQQTKNQK